MKNIILLAAAVLLGACNSPQTTSPQQEEHNHSDHSAVHSPELSVKLDNGKKWAANPETTLGIENMISIVEDFDRKKGDYARLQNELMDEFETIIQKCTMDGEAHNQLHNYLFPLKGEIEEASPDNLDEIKDHLQSYYNYFE